MRHLLLILCGLLLVTPAFAAAPGPTDTADLKRIEAYINTLQSIRARVLQLNPDGTDASGLLQIQRQQGSGGKLRLDYDAPAKSFIIADGNSVHYWDDTLQQTSSVPQSDSPAALILKAQVDFTASSSNGLTVTDITHEPGEIAVTMYKTNDPASGKLTLVFEDTKATGDLKLRQWRVRDAQGAITRVTLQNLETGVSFDRSIFQYRPPSFDKRGKNE